MDMGLAVLSGQPVIRVVSGPVVSGPVLAIDHAAPRGTFGGIDHRTGDAIWVSSETVMSAATQFSTDLRQFTQEVNANSNFGKGGYENAPPAQKATHEAFILALQKLEYDWWGIGNDEYGTELFWARQAKLQRDSGRKFAWKSTIAYSDESVLVEALTKDEIGFEEYLRIQNKKTLSTVGAAELSLVEGYRNRLKQLVAMYKNLGYNLASPITPDPPKPPATPADAILSGIKWISGAVIVGGVVYLAYRFIPSGLFSRFTAPAAAPAVPAPGVPLVTLPTGATHP
jgi:hypothetical protein